MRLLLLNLWSVYSSRSLFACWCDAPVLRERILTFNMKYFKQKFPRILSNHNRTQLQQNTDGRRSESFCVFHFVPLSFFDSLSTIPRWNKTTKCNRTSSLIHSYDGTVTALHIAKQVYSNLECHMYQTPIHTFSVHVPHLFRPSSKSAFDAKRDFSKTS